MLDKTSFRPENLGYLTLLTASLDPSKADCLKWSPVVNHSFEPFLELN